MLPKPVLNFNKIKSPSVKVNDSFLAHSLYMQYDIVFIHGIKWDGYCGGTLVRGCRCVTSCCDLDLTFDLAIVALTFKI